MKSEVVDIDKIIIGDKRSISKAISVVENESKNKHSLLKEIYKHTGNAY